MISFTQPAQWNRYLSTETNTERLKAMSPVYDNTGSFRKLLGVLAYDLDNYGTIASLEGKRDWSYFQQKYTQDANHCPASGISWSVLEDLRATYGSDSVCGTLSSKQIGWYPKRCQAGYELLKDGDYYFCKKCSVGTFSGGPFRCVQR